MARPSPFLRRYAAYSLDVLIVVLLAMPVIAWELRGLPKALDAAIAALELRIGVLLGELLRPGTGLYETAEQGWNDPALRAGIEHLAGLLAGSLVLAVTVVVTAAALWFITFEATRQATPGKAALGLRVTDTVGAAPGWPRAALRFVAGAPSWAMLHLGHAMAAWTRDRRALHDFIAGTRVELREGVDPRLPAWAQAWLWLQAVAVVGGTGYVLLAYLQLLAAVLDGGLG